MAKKPVESAITATLDEIIASIESMPSVAFYRLKVYADYKMRALGWAARGREGKDLLNEALRSTLEGAGESGAGRKWYTAKQPSFADHMRSAMQSIASHWKEAADEEERSSCDVSYEDESGETIDPVEQAASGDIPFERECEAKQRIDRLLELLADDEIAQYILILKLEGSTPDDIRQQLSISAAEFEAKWKKIQYRARVNRI